MEEHQLKINEYIFDVRELSYDEITDDMYLIMRDSAIFTGNLYISDFTDFDVSKEDVLMMFASFTDIAIFIVANYIPTAELSFLQPIPAKGELDENDQLRNNRSRYFCIHINLDSMIKNIESRGENASINLRVEFVNIERLFDMGSEFNKNKTHEPDIVSAIRNIQFIEERELKDLPTSESWTLSLDEVTDKLWFIRNKSLNKILRYSAFDDEICDDCKDMFDQYKKENCQEGKTCLNLPLMFEKKSDAEKYINEVIRTVDLEFRDSEHVEIVQVKDCNEQFDKNCFIYTRE